MLWYHEIKGLMMVCMWTYYYNSICIIHKLFETDMCKP